MCNRGAAGSGKPNEGVLRQGSADPHTTANARIHDFGCGMAGTNQAGGAADIFLEIITQPFLGFDGIVPGSSNQATV